MDDDAFFFFRQVLEWRLVSRHQITLDATMYVYKEKPFVSDIRLKFCSDLKRRASLIRLRRNRTI
jgi:hypothetical protein